MVTKIIKIEKMVVYISKLLAITITSLILINFQLPSETVKGYETEIYIKI